MVKSCSGRPSSPAQKNSENAMALRSSRRAWWRDSICTSLWRRALKKHNVDPAKIFQEYLPGRNVPPGHACRLLFVKGSRCSYFSPAFPEAWGLEKRCRWHPRALQLCQNGTLTLCLCCILQDVYPKDGKFCRVFNHKGQTVCPVSCVPPSRGLAVLHKTRCYVMQNHVFMHSLKSVMLILENSKS